MSKVPGRIILIMSALRVVELRLTQQVGYLMLLLSVEQWTTVMIKSFKHKGLKRFFDKGDVSKLHQEHVKRINQQLDIIHTDQEIEDVDLPGYFLHELKGSRKETWSITVRGNWRITFEFRDGNAYILNYEDYH
mgnify:CR=1 FL=1